MSAIEGLIDTRDVTIVIELSQMLSNPLPHLSSTMAVRFSAIICSEKDFVPSGTQVTKLKSKRLTFEGKKEQIIRALKEEASVLPAVIDECEIELSTRSATY